MWPQGINMNSVDQFRPSVRRVNILPYVDMYLRKYWFIYFAPAEIIICIQTPSLKFISIIISVGINYYIIKYIYIYITTSILFLSRIMWSRSHLWTRPSVSIKKSSVDISKLYLSRSRPFPHMAWCHLAPGDLRTPCWLNQAIFRTD